MRRPSSSRDIPRSSSAGDLEAMLAPRPSARQQSARGRSSDSSGLAAAAAGLDVVGLSARRAESSSGGRPSLAPLNLSKTGGSAGSGAAATPHFMPPLPISPLKAGGMRPSASSGNLTEDLMSERVARFRAEREMEEQRAARQVLEQQIQRMEKMMMTFASQGSDQASTAGH